MASSQERWIKYMSLALALGGLASRVIMWLQSSEAPTGAGGEDITASEIAQLQPVIQDSINQGFMAAKIPVMATLTLIPLE